MLILLRLPLSASPTHITGENVLEIFKGKVADWWIPNEVAFVDELPHTATGKLLKTELRKQFADYTFTD